MVPIMYVVVMTYIWIGRSWIFPYNLGIVVLHVFTSLLGGVPLCIPWNSTRRDHPGNPEGVSWSGPVNNPI